MNESFKEIHLRSLFRLLGHEGHYSRVGSLDFSEKVISPKTGKESFKYEEKIIKGEEALIEYAKQFNGKRNVFISRAFRAANGSVIGTNCVTLDLDPIRDKNTAATKEQNELALLCGRNILKRYAGGYLASSGNGALLIYRLPKPILGAEALKEHYEKERILFKELQELIGEEVKLDGTYYSEAILKAIGTMSTKGEIFLRRCSRWLEYPINPFRGCQKLLSRLEEIKIQAKSTTAVSLPLLDTKFKGDRSTADFALVSLCKQSGIGPEDALQALRINPLGRQTDEKDQARLIGKIYGGTAINNSTKGTDNYFAELFTPKGNSDNDIRTGFTHLDNALGPFPRGELVTFAARSGFGKTTFGCTIAEQWRMQGKKILYFSTEMQRDYILHKMVSLHCGIPLAHTIQKQFSQDEVQRIKQYEQELLRAPVIICDEFQPTLQLVQNEILKHAPDIVIFDHITQSGTHWEHIAQFSRGLKDIASKENLPIVLLSMLNEPPRGSNGIVGTSVRGDVRGSQEIIFLSAIFCMFSNPYEVKGNFQPVDVLVAKNRYGISNQVVPLSVDKSISKFIERNISHEPNEM